MAHATPQGLGLLRGSKRLTRFEKGLGTQLPEAYKKFWREWKLTAPAAVHYLPKSSEWERDELTGEIRLMQNIPLPLIDTAESNNGIWGGEAVVQGFQKRHPQKRRVPHFWVPVLRRSVLHSQVLNEYMSMVVTDRTIEQIHDSHGFDHYLLKNLACDLRSTLALKIKRDILLELLNGCPKLANNPTEQRRVLAEYQRYLESYTPEEIDWYGHTYSEAIRKLQAHLRAQNPIMPHKVQFRMKLIDQLKEAGIHEASGSTSTGVSKETTEADIENLTKLEAPASNASNWLSKINPFGRKHET